MSNIPNRLIELVAAQQIIPFLGSGFSIPSGIPSWPDLVTGLIRNCVSDSQANILGQLSQYLGNADLADVLDSLSTTEFAAKEYLFEQINSVRYKPSDYHRILLDINFDTVITTNWDLLIDSAFSANQIPSRVIYRDADVAQYDPTRAVQILKIHGTITDQDSLIYKHSQYLNFWSDRPLLLNLLCTLMATRSFLFVGYGFGDPNIIGLLDTLRDRLGRLRREHYALAYGSNTIHEAWKRLGVNIIDVAEFGGAHGDYETSINQFLMSLSESSRGVCLSNLERARLVNQELERLSRRMPPKPTLRMRGALGWLSNPSPIPGDPVYGSDIQDAEERRMTELICNYLDCNAQSKVRCILHLEVDPLVKNGYQPRHIIRRLTTIMELINRYDDRIEIVHQAMPSQLNHMIFDEQSSLLGFKRSRVLGINRAIFTRARPVVRAEVKHFDDDFREISEGNKMDALELGIEIENPKWRSEYILRLLSEQCQILNSRIDVSQITNMNLGLSKDIILFANALEFALEKHHEYRQTREDGITPYGIHILRVIERLRTVGLVGEYDVLAAAALHDVVEDCEVTIDYLKSTFGDRISAIVGELTRTPGQPRDEYIAQFNHASNEAKSIKLADRWDNVLDLSMFNKDIFGNVPAAEYLQESKRVLLTCAIANLRLATALERAIHDTCIQFEIN